MAKKEKGIFKDPRKATAPPAPCADPKHQMMGAMPKKMKGKMSA